MKTEKKLMKIPVMMMTAEQNPKLSSDSFAAGAVVFLPKPFTTSQLQVMLRMLISKSQGAGLFPMRAGARDNPRRPKENYDVEASAERLHDARPRPTSLSPATPLRARVNLRARALRVRVDEWRARAVATRAATRRDADA
jgi:DNA-binding response OmpR family regulator